MKKAVVVFSGGIDSISMCTYLKEKYELYGISFLYGQKANQEIKKAKAFAKILKLKEHKIVNISFMKELYGNTNVLTSKQKKIPSKFNYSIVVPIRNGIFLSVATAWAFSINASLVAYGAHTGDKNYPDCRPEYIKAYEEMANLATKQSIEGDRLTIHTPLIDQTKAQIIKQGLSLGVDYSQTISCYQANNKGEACGECDACVLRQNGFTQAGVIDPTKYQ